MGAEILVSKVGETVHGKVVGRKRDHDGNPLADSSNDEPLYIVEYPDGSLSTEGYNALISALNLQLDDSVTSIIPFRKYSDTNGDPRAAGATKRAGFS